MGTTHKETCWLAYLCNCASPYRRSTHTFQSKLDNKWYWSYHLLPEVRMELEFFQRARRLLNHWLRYGEYERPKPVELTAEELKEKEAVIDESLRLAYIANVERKTRKRWYE